MVYPCGVGDPDVRVGRGKKGFMLGYQSLFLVDIEGFPLGRIEAPLNVNEKQLVEPLLDRVLGESIEVELAVADSQLESETVFMLLEALKVSHIVTWRKLKRRVNPPDVLSEKERMMWRALSGYGHSISGSGRRQRASTGGLNADWPISG
ncbi:MAG: hypothetical protein V1710_01710 [Candidatus Bathyarchaeota archaeon]